MAKSPLDDPTFPTANAPGARSTIVSPEDFTPEPVQQEPTAEKKQIAELRALVEKLMIERVAPATSEFAGRAEEPVQQEPIDEGADRVLGIARDFGGRAQETIGNLSGPSRLEETARLFSGSYGKPEKKSINTNEMLELVSRYIPNPKDTRGWPDEAKVCVSHLSGMIIGMVLGSQIKGQEDE